MNQIAGPDVIDEAHQCPAIGLEGKTITAGEYRQGAKCVERGGKVSQAMPACIEVLSHGVLGQLCKLLQERTRAARSFP